MPIFLVLLTSTIFICSSKAGTIFFLIAAFSWHLKCVVLWFFGERQWLSTSIFSPLGFLPGSNLDSGGLSPRVIELPDCSWHEGVSRPCLDRWQVSGWVMPGQGCGHLRMEQVDVVSENLQSYPSLGPSSSGVSDDLSVLPVLLCAALEKVVPNLWSIVLLLVLDLLEPLLQLLHLLGVLLPEKLAICHEAGTSVQM